MATISVRPARAQDATGAAAPLVVVQAAPPGQSLLTAASARNALELGFPSLAAELYRAMLEGGVSARRGSESTGSRLDHGAAG